MSLVAVKVEEEEEIGLHARASVNDHVARGKSRLPAWDSGPAWPSPNRR